jgi:hypothetical protein
MTDTAILDFDVDLVRAKRPGRIFEWLQGPFRFGRGKRPDFGLFHNDYRTLRVENPIWYRDLIGREEKRDQLTPE